jgi:hypothetical protein
MSLPNKPLERAGMSGWRDTERRSAGRSAPMRYAAFDAARAFLARWPLSAKNRTFDYGKKWASI